MKKKSNPKRFCEWDRECRSTPVSFNCKEMIYYHFSYSKRVSFYFFNV